MRFTATKLFSLEVIGDIRLKFDYTGRPPKGKVIIAKNLHRMNVNNMSIDRETEAMIRKEMKAKGSDLLTDGKKFYTLFDGSIGEIEHPQFQKELELHEELLG